MTNLSNINIEAYPNHQILTYHDAMSQLSAGILDQLLRTSLLMLGMEIICLWYVQGWDLPSFSKMDWKNKELVKRKALRAAAMICFVPAIFMPLLIILYQLGAPI